ITLSLPQSVCLSLSLSLPLCLFPFPSLLHSSSLCVSCVRSVLLVPTDNEGAGGGTGLLYDRLWRQRPINRTCAHTHTHRLTHTHTPPHRRHESDKGHQH